MGRKLGLRLEDVVTAAAALADADGLHSLSLAGVAGRLGVRSPSLYNHVAGLPGLRRHLGIRASEELAAALAGAHDQTEDPDTALRALCRAYRRFAREHPGLYTALLPVPSPHGDPEAAAAFLEPLRIVGTVVARFGTDLAADVHVLRWLRSTLHGFVDLEMHGGFGLAESIDDSFEMLVDMLVRALRADTAGRPTVGSSMPQG